MFEPNIHTNAGNIHATQPGHAHVKRAKVVQAKLKNHAFGFIHLISFILNINKLILNAINIVFIKRKNR